MTSSFNYQRFCRLARWTWAIDRPYTRKSFLAALSCIVVIFQIPNFFWLMTSSDVERDFPVIFASFWFLAAIVISGGMMFYSFKDHRDGFRELHLLPASNLEKFILRYLMTVLVQLAICLIAFLISDVLQYLVGWLNGREPLTWVISDIIRDWGNVHRAVNDYQTTAPENSYNASGFAMLSIILWLHTFLLLGCNFFRSIKFSWAFGILAALLIFLFLIAVVPADVIKFFTHDQPLLLAAILVVLSIANVILAYRLFCRRLHIARFINWF